MTTAFIGNLLNSNITSLISISSSTGQTSGANQVLPLAISATTTLGSGNYTYQWYQSNTPITFTAATSNSTNCTYSSLSVAGSTSIYCIVSDTWTGVQVKTENCVITWPIQLIPIISVTWSIPSNTTSTYNGAAQSVIVNSINPVNATYSLSTTTATNAGSVGSTILTGTGTYSGSFTSPNLTINSRALILSSAGPTTLNYNDGAQTIGYTVNNIPAGGGGAANYAVYGITQTAIGYYTAQLDANTNYSVGSPSSFIWNIVAGNLDITLGLQEEVSYGGKGNIYYIKYIRHNGPSQVNVHEDYGTVTTTDFALPLNVWTTSPNAWSNESKTVNYSIYNTPNYNNKNGYYIFP